MVLDPSPGAPAKAAQPLRPRAHSRTLLVLTVNSQPQVLFIEQISTSYQWGFSLGKSRQGTFPPP